jgi:tRNA threonylcarbamoyladenosine biosynthesis protein TsaB
VIVLAIDTCDGDGSVAVLRDNALLEVAAHQSTEEYSSWLLPAVANLLKGAGLSMRDVDAYAVAAGPGSFTGLRVGLTTVKAWSEVYGKSIAAVSRLEAMAVEADGVRPYVAAFVDARRGQVFGALYRRNSTELERIGEEMVIPPGRFVEWASELSASRSISWVSKDRDCALGELAVNVREMRQETVQAVSAVLAPAIGRLGWARLASGKTTDALSLDANYVRRSDAEIFSEGRAAAHGH